jgi:hypothetical protein
MISDMTVLPLQSVFNHVDPPALLVLALMACTTDGHALLAIGVSVNELRKRLRSFLYKLRCGRLGSAG